MSLEKNGWVDIVSSVGSNKIDYSKMWSPKPQYNIYFPLKEDRHKNCQLCHRKEGNKRKNKVLYDENRAVEIETGCVTKIEKTFLIDAENHEMNLVLCQECRTRIEIENESTIIYDEKDYAYPPKRWRFKRKNEIAKDSRIISISKKLSFPIDDHYGQPHWVDTLDNYMFKKFENEYLNKPNPLSSLFKVGATITKEDCSIIKSDNVL